MGDFALEKKSDQRAVQTGNKNRRTGNIIPQLDKAPTAPASQDSPFDGNQEGMIVRAGAPLLRILRRKWPIGDSFARAKADYEYAKSQWERAGKLIGERIISQKKNTKIRVWRIRRHGWHTRLCPAGKGRRGGKGAVYGLVKDLKAAHGSFAEKGAPLLTLVKSSRARLTADVPQEYFSRLPEVVSAALSASDGRVYDTEKRTDASFLAPNR